MSLKYQAGEEIMVGDLAFFHGEAAEIELVAEPSSTNPDHEWYVKEFGGGVGLLEQKSFGRVFIQADQLPENEDLEFVARRDSQYAVEDASGLEKVTNEWLKRRVHDSNELSTAGDVDAALELLTVSIHTALKANRLNWVQTLCRHASAVADSKGDLASVRRYRGLAVQHAPNDAQNLYGLADVLLRQGEAEFARSMAAKAYDLTRKSSDEPSRSLAELLINKWPELKNATRQE